MKKMFFNKFFSKTKIYKKVRKAQDDFNTKEYSFNDFLEINENHKIEINSFLGQYRSKFEVKNKDKRLRGYMEEPYFILVTELINFYNNDVCISSAIFNIMNKYKSEYKFRVVGYYADNIAIKIISSWDYLFQILSKYLGTDLLGDYRTRDRIIAFKSKRVRLVNEDQIIKVVYEDYPQEKLNEIVSNIIKENKVLKIDKKNKQLKKGIKNIKLSRNSRIDKILQLYSKDQVQVLKSQIRNDIIHKRSLTFKTSISNVDILPVVGTTINPEGWYKFDDLSNIIIQNLILLREAIQLLNEIIKLDDFPNSLGDEEKVYKVNQLKCSSCGEIQSITKEFIDILNNSGYKYKCNKCGFSMDNNGEYEVNQRDYYVVQLKNINYFADTTEKFKNDTN